MKRTGTSTGTLAPSVFFIIFIIFITSTLLTGAASARDRRDPATGGGREGSAQKIPDRPKTPAPRPQPVSRPVDRPVTRPPRPRPDDRPRDKYRSPEGIDRKDPPSGGTFRRKDPREHGKDPSPYDRFKKKKDMDTREKRMTVIAAAEALFRGSIPVFIPVLPGGLAPVPVRRSIA